MTTLRERYQGLVCDLDGVVYRGPSPVEHAVEALGRPGTRVVYATNNASRPPADVADHLVRLGLGATAEQVVTSSQAGARRVHEQVGDGARVLAVGGPGVSRALAEIGLEVVTPADLRSAATEPAASVAATGPAPVVAVLQGYGPEVTTDDLARASYAIADGAFWVATNTDATLPTDRGVAPGNGMYVAAVGRATGVTPRATGKPAGDLYDLACDRLGGREVLGIGDRLDTDILGAMAAGLDSLWVLTGVDDLSSLALAPGRPTPTWVAADLRSLDAAVPEVSRDGDWWVCDRWRVRLAADAVGPTQVEVQPLDPAPGTAGAVEQRRRAAVLNAGMQLLLAERDDAGDSDASGKGDVARNRLVAIARSVAGEAGLHPSGAGD